MRIRCGNAHLNQWDLVKKDIVNIYKCTSILLVLCINDIITDETKNAEVF